MKEDKCFVRPVSLYSVYGRMELEQRQRSVGRGVWRYEKGKGGGWGKGKEGELCTYHGVFGQVPILLLKSLQHLLSVLSQFGLAVRHDGLFEEAGTPLFIALGPFSGFYALPLFKFLLELGGLGVLLVEDCRSDGSPKALALVWELGGCRRYDFGDWEERV